MPAEETIEVESVLRPFNEIPYEDQAFKGEEPGDSHADPDFPNPPLSGAETQGLEAATRWRAAKALVALRNQVNEAAPNRNKASDGTIGDSNHCGHANATSDHCARVLDGGVAVVTAIDITHDVDNGCDAHAIAEKIRQSKDSRVKYIISNARIASFAAIDGADPWVWRPYNGRNPHIKHCHISVKADSTLFDSTTRWAID